MFAKLGSQFNLQQTVAPAVRFLRRPAVLFRTYDRSNLRPDLTAGLTVTVILLPQAIAFALIAELPPQMGIYSAILGAIVGGLWGSSNQIHTGPTNAISLLVFSSLAAVVAPGSMQFAIAAGVMAVMAGLFQLLMGLFRLGMLVNFVSHSVIVGFASGAGVLIAIKQVSPLLGLSFESHNVAETLVGIAANLSNSHTQTAVIGLGTMLLIVILRRINNRLPAALITMMIASLVVFLLRLDEAGVRVIGQLPTSFPPLADLPLFNLEVISQLSTGALAVAAIGLVETTAIARSVSAQTGQRLDSNQEFVGQGMANIFMGLFSGYPGAGSFSRTAVNFKAGAKSSMAAVFSGIFMIIALFTLAPLAAYLPTAALAGVLIITAYGMVDKGEIARIWRSHPGDASIMVTTLVGTLFLEIEFAVLLGIILSLGLYIWRTSTPRIQPVLPDDTFSHFIYRPEQSPCPQLAIIEVYGDLYFGAVNYVEEFITDYADAHPEQRYLLLRLDHVNTCDFSGIHMLETLVKMYRDQGGDVFMAGTNYRVKQMMLSSEFDSFLGENNILDEDEAIGKIFYQNLDPAICIYECPIRAFRECQNLPKRIDLAGIPLMDEIASEHIMFVEPLHLWQQLHPASSGNGAAANTAVPHVVDVREPREYRQGHIAEAQLIPLPTLLSTDVKLPADKQIVLVCRSGRRSRRAAAALQNIGCMNVQVLQGGMLAWNSAGLLEAVDF
ncbi:SulP family inorganic anion transporter [Candidatus Leptofilum sp.]|uniref:SulP family inorganic anion transporter n=1 Tax=Candidatus Leptofilum sp. TaxID=3241576 RepID=UPI003B5CAF7B